MITLELEQDDMFQMYPYALLPVLTLWNSGNFTEDAADKQFGELITGLKVKSAGQIVLIILGCLLVTLPIAIILK